MIRRALALASLLAAATPAAAQQAGAGAAASAAGAMPSPPPATRLRKTTQEPYSIGAVRPVRPGEAAPMPNRDIEAPTDRLSGRKGARLEPMLLPQERQQGVTFGREHLRDTGPDRPFEAMVPGARIRIPFE